MIIYLTTNNINGKKYIGLDTRNNPNYYGSGTLITMALKKYGRKNFTKEILEQCQDIESLKKAEMYWIAYYNAVDSPDFYNLTHGGDIKVRTGWHHSAETIDKIRASNIGKNKGKRPSKETLKKMSNSHTGIRHTERTKQILSFKNRGNKSRLGMPHLQETKEKIGAAHRGKKKTPISVLRNFQAQKKKAVVQFDLNNNVVAEFVGMRDAARKTGISRECISHAINGRSNTAGGYKWKLKTNIEGTHNE